MKKLSKTIREEYEGKGPDCPTLNEEIRDLSDYFGAFNNLLTADEPFWYRGHSDNSYELTPSALRYPDEAGRNAAIALVAGFRRLAEIKLHKAPVRDDDLSWLQLAQHYGLGTRLLDWTENAAVALYFACQRPDVNGTVFILNPIDLNMVVDPKRPRVFDAQLDADIIQGYLKLSGRATKRGKPTIAIHPVWNSERIVLQRGVFTLHGAKHFGLDRSQAPSLVKVPVLAKYKQDLLLELDRIGIGEAGIFPELEHLCNYLKRRARLS